MELPLVAVASVGGTITMTARADGAVTPALGAADVVAAVPAVADVARITPTTLGTLPGASMSVPDVLVGLEWAREALRLGATGAILIQGTDTIEETAYLLDLYWDRPEPLVVTGAMRAAHAVGADGPANVLGAVRAAVAAPSRALGVLVVMNDEIHAAARVRKCDATGVDAFRSPNFGPLGRVGEAGVVYANRPARWPSLPTPTVRPAPRVALIETWLGDEGELIQRAVDGGYAGVVVAGFGAGHVPARLADVVGDAVPKVPVVVATRTGSGSTLRATYGFAGSESDLLARGAILAGWLDPRKARTLLWSLLAAGAGRADIAAAFSDRGGAPGGPR